MARTFYDAADLAEKLAQDCIFFVTLQRTEACGRWKHERDYVARYVDFRKVPTETLRSPAVQAPSGAQNAVPGKAHLSPKRVAMCVLALQKFDGANAWSQFDEFAPFVI